MTVHFFIRFSTKPGQAIFITGDVPELGSSDSSKAVVLSYFNNDFWDLALEVDPLTSARISYKYILQTESGEHLVEGGMGRVVELAKSGIDQYQVVDTWNYSGEFENAFFTSPYQSVLLKDQHTRLKQKPDRHFTHIFKVQAPLLEKSQVVCLLGSGLYLNEWSQDDPQLMMLENGWYTAKLNMPRENFPLQYKYGIYDTRHKQFVGFESGPNRWLQGDAGDHKLTIVHDGFVHMPNNTWRAAGVSIPVFVSFKKFFWDRRIQRLMLIRRLGIKNWFETDPDFARQ